VGRSAAATLAETQRSLPEIVDSYCQFMKQVADRYDRIIIAVDELDKLESDQAAQRFVNEVKAVFGTRKCFYLISVSDAAISSFERRGLNFSNAFDSAFDDMIRVDYLSLEESRSLVSTRAMGIPQSFLCFLHALSGGLPRDLIRACREIVKEAETAKQRDLPALAKIILTRDLVEKVVATRTSVRALRLEPDVGTFLQRLTDFEAQASLATVTSKALRQESDALWKQIEVLSSASLQPGQNTPERRTLEERMREIAGYLYLAGILVELFTERLRTPDDLDRWARPGERGEASVIARLARARQELRVNPRVAYTGITLLRGELGLKEAMN
jgi:hypothetical protein